jgi:uncharacterized protein (DUF302 family)
MLETRYGLKASLPMAYHDAVARTTAALKTQGFGVLTTIDVQQTLKQNSVAIFASTPSWARVIRH